jgi:hypothetical protein
MVKDQRQEKDASIGVDVGGCRRNEDCPQGHCCTVGMTRYAVPSCLPLGQMNDPCIPNNGPQNFSLSYPTKEAVQVWESYLLFCPCETPLFECDRISVSCQAPQIDKSLAQNELDE